MGYHLFNGWDEVDQVCSQASSNFVVNHRMVFFVCGWGLWWVLW